MPAIPGYATPLNYISLQLTAFKGGHLELHKDLTKAQSSALIQMRTGKIGLNTFLYYRKVPGHETPIYIYGNGLQTPEHLFTDCIDPRSHNLTAIDYTTISEVKAGLSNPETAGKMTRSL